MAIFLMPPTDSGWTMHQTLQILVANCDAICHNINMTTKHLSQASILDLLATEMFVLLHAY